RWRRPRPVRPRRWAPRRACGPEGRRAGALGAPRAVQRGPLSRSPGLLPRCGALDGGGPGQGPRAPATRGHPANDPAVAGLVTCLALRRLPATNPGPLAGHRPGARTRSTATPYVPGSTRHLMSDFDAAFLARHGVPV